MIKSKRILFILLAFLLYQAGGASQITDKQHENHSDQVEDKNLEPSSELNEDLAKTKRSVGHGYAFAPAYAVAQQTFFVPRPVVRAPPLVVQPRIAPGGAWSTSHTATYPYVRALRPAVLAPVPAFAPSYTGFAPLPFAVPSLPPPVAPAPPPLPPQFLPPPVALAPAPLPPRFLPQPLPNPVPAFPSPRPVIIPNAAPNFVPSPPINTVLPPQPVPAAFFARPIVVSAPKPLPAPAPTPTPIVPTFVAAPVPCNTPDENQSPSRPEPELVPVRPTHAWRPVHYLPAPPPPNRIIRPRPTRLHVHPIALKVKSKHRWH